MESFELLVDQAMMKRKSSRIEYRPTVGSPCYSGADRQRKNEDVVKTRGCLCDLDGISWRSHLVARK
jgi:hypothetical protein